MKIHWKAPFKKLYILVDRIFTNIEDDLRNSKEIKQIEKESYISERRINAAYIGKEKARIQGEKRLELIKNPTPVNGTGKKREAIISEDMWKL